METAEQVGGVSGALLAFAHDPARIATVNELIDRYAHRLRNRLNSMKLSLYLARRLSGESSDVDWERAESAYRAMEGLIVKLQSACAPIRPTTVSASIGEWLSARVPGWRRQLSARGIELEVKAPPGDVSRHRFDADRLGGALDELVESWSASGPPGGRLRLGWDRAGDRVRVSWEGWPSAAGWLAPPADGTECLALPMLARVVASQGGRLQVRAGDDRRLRIVLSWPVGPDDPPIEAEP